jgi:4,5-dihydroxyphthalate decarboxylase
MALRLTVGCGLYDRTLPLAQGVIVPAGVTLDWTALPPGELFKLVLESRFDVAEMSLAYYSIMHGAGDRTLVALPIFLSRMFRHSALYIRQGAELTAERLKGARVGVDSYTMTAAVWVRWLLNAEYRLFHSDIEWFAGGMGPVPDRFRPKLPVKVVPNLPVEIVAEGQPRLEEMLVRGELDVLLSVIVPKCFVEGKARRLWPDYREREVATARKFGILPIMHTLVMDRALYEREPWAAKSLFDAFLQAKDICYEQLLNTDTPIVTLPWLAGSVDEARSIFGNDYWPYGLAKNAKVLDAFLGQLKIEGLLEKQPPLDEMFLAL